MKVVLTISSLSAGGAERVLCTLARMWLDQGHEVTVITYASSLLDHYHLPSNLKRIALNAQGDTTRLCDKVTGNIYRLQRLRVLLRAVSPDVVIAFGDTVNVLTVLACLGTPMRVVVSERTDPRRHALAWAWRALRRVLYPFASAVVVQTESVAQWVRHFVSPKRVHIIPNPISQFSPVRSCPEALRARRTIIAVGRLSREKGFDMLLRAFSRAGLPQHDWQLVILGDGPERPAIASQAKNLNIPVVMPGIVEEPQHWFQHSDLFVLSSRYEGFPNVLIEAMRCGLPVAAFDCPSGPSEIIRNEQTGLLIPPGDPDALAVAIARLASDASLRHRLGRAGANDVSERFSLNRVARLWEPAIAVGTTEAPSVEPRNG